MDSDEDVQALIPGLIESDARLDALFDQYGFEECCEDAFDVVQASWTQPTFDDESGPNAADVAVAMSHDAVLEAFEEHQVPGSSPQRLLDFATYYSEQSPGAMAGPPALLGRALERTGDVRRAESFYRQALTIDPDFSAAQRWLAGIEIDRGNLRAARSLLAAVFEARDPALVELDHHLSCQQSVGRNEPCPCGSSKKFKQCHRDPVTPTEELPGLVYYKLQRHLIENQRHQYVAFVSDAGGPELFSDSFPADVFAFEMGAAADYLAQRGQLLPTDERDIVEKMVATNRAMLEITNVAVGQSLALRNVITGEELEVAERQGPQGLQVGQNLLGRVIEVGGVHELVGIAIDVHPIGRDALLKLMASEYDGEALVHWYAELTAPNPT